MLVYLAVGTATQSQPISPPWADHNYHRVLVAKLRTRLPIEAIDFLPARRLGYHGHGYRLNLTAREILWNHDLLATHSDHRVRTIFRAEVPSLSQVA